MATVFQMIVSNKNARHHYAAVSVVDEKWHAAFSVGSPKTVCGIQLEGDDGVVSGPEKEGRVTCPTCRAVIEQIQNIKNWR